MKHYYTTYIYISKVVDGKYKYKIVRDKVLLKENIVDKSKYPSISLLYNTVIASLEDIVDTYKDKCIYIHIHMICDIQNVYEEHKNSLMARRILLKVNKDFPVFEIRQSKNKIKELRHKHDNYLI